MMDMKISESSLPCQRAPQGGSLAPTGQFTFRGTASAVEGFAVPCANSPKPNANTHAPTA